MTVRVDGKPLSENEKAATFLGWRTYECAGDPPEWADEHGNRAPDMSDPRNYMKALEDLPSNYGWTIGRDPGDELGYEIWNTKRPGVVRGSSARDALAARWDADQEGV